MKKKLLVMLLCFSILFISMPIQAYTGVEKISEDDSIQFVFTDDQETVFEKVSYDPEGHLECPDRKFRAIISGNTYPGTGSDLEGPNLDILLMKDLFEGWWDDGDSLNEYEEDYEILECFNYTEDDIKNNISSFFGEATEDDISYFYFSGHGASEGYAEAYYICFPDGNGSITLMSVAELKNCLDLIPGVKVVILDSCFSGGFIGRSENGEEDNIAEGFNQYVVDVFSNKNDVLNRNLADDGYAVITASSREEVSYSVMRDNPLTEEVDLSWLGLFTYHFYNLNCYRPEGSISDTWPISESGQNDFSVSFQEAYESTYEIVVLESENYSGGTAHMQFYIGTGFSNVPLFYKGITDFYVQDIVVGNIGEEFTIPFDVVSLASEGQYQFLKAVLYCGDVYREYEFTEGIDYGLNHLEMPVLATHEEMPRFIEGEFEFYVYLVYSSPPYSRSDHIGDKVNISIPLEIRSFTMDHSEYILSDEDYINVRFDCDASGSDIYYKYGIYTYWDNEPRLGYETEYGKDNYCSIRVNKGNSGSYELRVTIQDMYGEETTESVFYTICRPIGVTIDSVTGDLELPSVVGSNINWECKAFGNFIQYEWKIYKDGELIFTQPYEDESFLNYTTTSEGVYCAEVFVKDVFNETISKTSQVVKIGDIDITELSIISLNSNKESPQLINETIRWTCEAQGEELAYSWYIYKEGEEILSQAYGNVNYIDFTPTEGDGYLCEVYVKDKYRQKEFIQSDVMGFGGNYYSLLNIKEVKIDKESPQLVNVLIEFSCYAYGGGLNYEWHIYRDGEFIDIRPYYYSSDFYYMTSIPGDYQGKIYVRDNYGVIASAWSSIMTFEEPVPTELLINSIITDEESPQPTDTTVRWTCDAEGDGLEYAWYLYKDEVKIETYGYGSNNYLDYTPTLEGVYKVKVYVKDMYDEVKSKLSEIFTIGDQVPTELAINTLTTDVESPQPVDTAIRWTCEADGDGLVYAWYLYKDGVRINVEGYGNDNYLDYTPATEGVYRIKVYVKDQYGTVLSKYSELMIIGDQVAAELQVNTITADVESPQPVDTAIRWSCDALGDGLVYAWYLYEDGVRIDVIGYGSNNYLVYTPDTEGAYKVKAYVKDQYGAVQSKYSELMMIGDHVITELQVNSVTADAESPQPVDTEIRWTCDALGDGLVYAWYLYKDGVRIDVQGYGNDNFLDYTPTIEGVYKVKVYVKDQYGAVLSKYSELFTIGDQIITELVVNSLTTDLESPQPTDTLIRWTCDAVGDGMVYAWYVYQDGIKIEMYGYGNENYIDYTPTTEGLYRIKVYVKDQYGAVISKLSDEMTITNE